MRPRPVGWWPVQLGAWGAACPASGSGGRRRCGDGGAGASLYWQPSILGPESGEEAACQEFRQFWGDRSQLRTDPLRRWWCGGQQGGGGGGHRAGRAGPAHPPHAVAAGAAPGKHANRSICTPEGLYSKHVHLYCIHVHLYCTHVHLYCTSVEKSPVFKTACPLN